MKNSWIIVLAALISCNSNSTEEVVVQNENPVVAPPILDTMKWIVGSWSNVDEYGTMTESWSQTGDSVLTGIVIATQQIAASSTTEGGLLTDTLETIQIKQEWGKLFYIPAVADQNQGQPIKFKMTSCSPELFVFENAEHDFPTKITYQRFGKDSLVATISGIWEGAETSQSFPMKRTN